MALSRAGVGMTMLVRVVVVLSAWIMVAAAARASSDALLRTFAGHSAQVGAVAFSPDGRQVISGS